MSIAMQNDIDALKAKVAELESELKAKVASGEAVAKADWDALIARIEAIEHRLGAFGAKFKK